jgi:hypothetical protein
MSITVAMRTEISQLYVSLFGRAPDGEGLGFWVSSYSKGTSLASIAQSMYDTAPARAYYPLFATPSEIVTTFYTNVLGRAPDTEGLAFWVKEYSAATSQGAFFSKLISNVVNYNGTDAAGVTSKSLFANKVAVAQYYGEQNGTVAGATAALNGVTSAAASVDAAKAVILNTAVSGQTFTLTTGTDNIPGTAGGDSINGVLQDAGAAGTTIQPGDVVNGGAGTDTLSISVAGDIGTTSFTISAVQANSVENVLAVNFNTDEATDLIIATNLMTGVATVGASASSASGDTQFTGMKTMVAAEMTNGAGDLTLTYDGAQVVTGTADSQTLSVSNMTAGGFLSNGIETLNINTGLVKSTLASVASDTLKTVNVTGATDLTITAALDFASNGSATAPGAVVNASTFTGKLAITTTASEVLSVTGGSGDDTFTLGSLTKDDAIVGGNGTDTINMAAAALTTQFAKVSGVEKVAFTAAVANLAMDVSKLSSGVSTVEFNLSDGTDDATAVTGTISNLGTQTVVLKHTVANAGTDTDADGANATITGAVDTTADSVSIVLDAIGMVATAKLGYDSINVANFETVNIQSKKSTTVTANEVLSLTDTLTKTLTITGDADLTVTNTGTALTALNASALDGKLNATLGANKVTVTGGAKDDTIVFAGNLNNDDVVDGGLGKDTLTATVTGLTSTTGALKIANVETVTLDTTGANTLNLAGVTGATSVAVSANAQTITGLALATKLIVTGSASLTVTGADESGADDTLTVEQKLNGNVSNTIKTATTLENLSLVLNDTSTTANSATFVLTDAAAKKITVSESADTTTAGANVALGTLNKSVTTVDTSGVKGTQAFSVANTLTSATLSLSGAAAATVTGTGVNDTINVSSTGAVTHSIDAGAGTADVVNLAVKTGFVNVGSITNAETINVTVAAGNSIDLAAGGGASFATSARAVNILGGNSASTFAAGTVVTEVTTLNAGAFGGNLLATFGANVLDSTVTVTGGALATDQLTASYTTAATYASKTTGVEILTVSAAGAGTSAFGVDLTSNVGVTTINATVDTADTLTISKGTAGQLSVLVSATANSTLEYALADATGAADVASFELKDAGSNVLAAGASLKTTDIETVNVKISTNAESISLASIAMTDATKFASLVVTGDQALTVSALNANVTSINASGMTTGGSFTQTGRSQTTAATYTGSVGNDTFRMAHANDVIDGAAGTGDTLVITGNYILGGIQIALNATGDQVTTFNGSANAAIQSGFENVDLSAITGSAQADITAASTGSSIKGTANVDQINGGAGVDTVFAGAGADTVTLGDGNDIFVLDNVTTDTVNAGPGSADAIALVGGVTVANTVDFGTYTNFEKLIASGATDEVISFSAKADFFSDTGIFTIDLSADTSATGTNVVNLDAIATADTDFTITGSNGLDEITLEAAGNETNTIKYAATQYGATDVIVGFEAGTSATDGDIFDFSGILGAATTLVSVDGTTAIAATSAIGTGGSFTTASTGAVSITGKVVVFNNEAATITATNLAAEFAAGAAFAASVGASIVIVGDKDGGAAAEVWYVNSSLDGTAGSTTTNDVKLIGTLSTNIDIDAITGNQIA